MSYIQSSFDKDYLKFKSNDIKFIAYNFFYVSYDVWDILYEQIIIKLV